MTAIVCVVFLSSSVAIRRVTSNLLMKAALSVQLSEFHELRGRYIEVLTILYVDQHLARRAELTFL